MRLMPNNRSQTLLTVRTSPFRKPANGIAYVTSVALCLLLAQIEAILALPAGARVSSMTARKHGFEARRMRGITAPITESVQDRSRGYQSAADFDAMTDGLLCGEPTHKKLLR
jgi:hypothetical protein